MYTVTWNPVAEETLATLWCDEPVRDVITQAANPIDLLLKVEPMEQGESRVSTLRIMFQNPLAIIFDVSIDDRLVSVLRIWRYSN